MACLVDRASCAWLSRMASLLEERDEETARMARKNGAHRGDAELVRAGEAKSQGRLTGARRNSPAVDSSYSFRRSYRSRDQGDWLFRIYLDGTGRDPRHREGVRSRGNSG